MADATPRGHPGRLAALVEEAIVDAHDEEEQLAGFACLLQDHVEAPFPAMALGDKILVDGFEEDPNGQRILAVVRKGRRKYRFDLRDLDFGNDANAAPEAVQAYLYWNRKY